MLSSWPTYSFIGIVLSALILTIGTTLVLTFHSFLSSFARSWYLSIFSFSFSATLASPGTATSIICWSVISRKAGLSWRRSKMDNKMDNLLVRLNFFVLLFFFPSFQKLIVKLQSTTKWVETLRPKWAFWRFPDFKRGKDSFSSPIPSMQCCATVRATFRKQETSQLWMEGIG